LKVTTTILHEFVLMVGFIYDVHAVYFLNVS